MAEETSAAIQLETYPEGRPDDGEVRLADEPLVSGGLLTVEIDVEDCPRPSVGLERTGTELRIYWHEHPETDQPRVLKIPDLAPPGEYTFWVTCNFANEGPSWTIDVVIGASEGLRATAICNPEWDQERISDSEFRIDGTAGFSYATEYS